MVRITSNESNDVFTKTLNTNTAYYNTMINSITFSKKTMATHGTLVVSIPPEIIEDMNLSDGEMVEVRLIKKPHVQTINHGVGGGFR